MTATRLRLSATGKSVALREMGHGQPLFLIHGVGMQSAAWEPQIENLSNDFRVIAPDMPGHGGSDPIATGSKLPDYVEWLRHIVASLGIESANIAGHSMGALIALGFAVEHPDQTKRVALLNGVYKRAPAARKAVADRAKEIQEGGTDLTTPLNRWFGDSMTDPAVRALVTEWLTSVDRKGYGTAYVAFAQGDATYADRIGKITCPFLALTGSGDPNSTPEMSTAMAEAARQGRAVTIEGHRHMVNLTAPDEVTAQLRAWLDMPVEQEDLQ